MARQNAHIGGWCACHHVLQLVTDHLLHHNPGSTEAVLRKVVRERVEQGHGGELGVSLPWYLVAAMLDTAEHADPCPLADSMLGERPRRA